MKKKKSIDVLIFHSEESSLIAGQILQGLSYSVYDPSTDLKIDFTNILKAVINCIKYKHEVILKAISSIKYQKLLYRELRDYLHTESVKKINPKIVITWIDNSSIFHKCSNNLKNIPFMAIQNGGRHVWCANEVYSLPEEVYHIDEYFCFGGYVEDLFAKYNHDIKQYNKCGSLKYSLFYKLFGKEKYDLKYDICLISQWGMTQMYNAHKLPDRWKNLGRSVTEVAKTVGYCAIKNNLSVCIALRGESKLEKEFYRKYFGNNVSFQIVDKKNYSSYIAASQAEMCIALNSTLATEMFGAGKKVLFINPFDEQWLKPVKEGIWYCTGTDTDTISRKINYLLDLNQNNYISKSSNEMKYIMNFDSSNLAYETISKRVNAVVNEISMEYIC